MVATSHSNKSSAISHLAQNQLIAVEAEEALTLDDGYMYLRCETQTQINARIYN